MANIQSGNNMAWKALATVALAGVFAIGGCSSSPRYSDSMSAVKDSLMQNDLGNIQVSQDRDKGVITLTGTVPTDAQKTDAASVVKETATTYTIDNEITVVPPNNANAPSR